MEKRLPLFLFLSFLVLVVWAMFFAPKPKPRPESPADAAIEDARGASRPGGVSITVDDQRADRDVLGELVEDTEERTSEPLLFGRPGAPGRYLARFTNRGAALIDLRLGSYVDEVGLTDEQRADPEHWVQLVLPVETPDGPTGSMLLSTSPSSRELAGGIDLATALWTMEVLGDASAPSGIEFQLAPGGGVRFVKRFVFDRDAYRFRMELELHNEAAGSSSLCGFLLTPAGSMPPALDDRFYVEPQAVAVGPAGVEPGDMSLDKKERMPSASDRIGTLKAPVPLAYAGLHNKYFAVLLSEVLESPTAKRTLVGASWRRVYDAGWAAKNPSEAQDAWRFIDTDIALELRLPDRGESVRHVYDVYAGPKKRDLMLDDDPAHGVMLESDLGWFSSIGRGLTAVLGLFERLTGNWGVSIILLTLLIRTLLFPLNRRFQTSMARYQKKMKRVQPRLEELKKKFANDQQKQRQEQARIMQEEGAFPPLGGCLPMFVQIPIFIGLFSALRTNFDLRQAPFAGWITDLSQPDQLLQLDVQVPLLVTTFDLTYLNLLPILMVVLWVLQQRGMPTPADEQAARMQKMMTFMPIVMGFFLYNYAAGLSLYMITQSGLGIFEQQFIKKRWPIDDAEPEGPKKPGCGPFSGLMQNLAEKQKEQMKRVEAAQRQQQEQRARTKKRRK